MLDKDEDRLFPPIAYWDTNADYLSSCLANMANERVRAAHPALANWAKATRLNPSGEIGLHRDHPEVVAARERVKRYGAEAAGKVVSLLRSA